MKKINFEKMLDIQKRLRRGTKVEVFDEKTGERFEVEYDGISDIDCPHKICQLHPEYIGKAEDVKTFCQGFMIWRTETEELRNCPYMGGEYFTIGDQKYIVNIIKKIQGKTENDIIIQKVEVTNF